MWAHVAAPVLGLGVTVAVIVEAARTTRWVGPAWLAAGLIALAAQRSGRRAHSA